MGEMHEQNERLTDVWNAIVEAGRQVVRDKHVTEDELHTASRFLQELGAQNFLVGLVDMMFATAASETHAAESGVQKANLEGPLYRPGAPVRHNGVLYDKQPSDQARFLTLSGRVFNAETGAAIAGAELDFWQSDEFGRYDAEGYNLRGIVVSDAEGNYELKTIAPAPYTMHEDDLISDLFGMLGRHAYRSAHLHLKIRVAGQVVLTTQFFDPHSKYLEDDVVIGAVRPDVMMKFVEVDGGPAGQPGYQAVFDFPVRLAR
jgi:catechol 1,2-dioxygenase